MDNINNNIQTTARNASKILHQYQTQSSLPFDVLALSETHYQKPQEEDQISAIIPNFCQGMSAYHSHATPTDRSAGLVLLYAPWVPPPIDLLAPHLSANVGVYKSNFTGRFMLHHVILQHHSLVIAFIYGYANSNTAKAGTLLHEAYTIASTVFAAVRASNNGQSKSSLIMTGDLNTFTFKRNVQCYDGHAKHPQQQSYRPGRTKHAKVRLSEIEDAGHLVHAWDIANTGAVHARYLTNTTTNAKSKKTTRTGIDHLYIDKDSVALVSEFLHCALPKVDGRGITTHDILDITICGIFQHSLKFLTPVAAFPHLRSYPFKNRDFQLTLADAIAKVSEAATTSGNWIHAYDTLHGIITKECLIFAKQAEKKMRLKMCQLERTMESLSNQGALKSGSMLLPEYEVAKKRLQHCKHLVHLESIHTVKHLTSLKAVVAEDENIPEASIEWMNSFRDHSDAAKIIPGIFINKSSTITDPDEMRNMAYTHYSKKFAKPSIGQRRRTREKLNQDPTIPEFTKLLPALGAEAIAALSAPFTAAEVSPVLAEFKKKFDTSPGIDALPAEFFASEPLREGLATLIANVTNQIAQSGNLTGNFNHIVIRLLHKEGKSRIHFDGYRPISLLPIITRIIARIISLRLHPHLAGLIHRQQTAYVPGRRMDHNMLLLQQFFLDAAADDSTAMLLQIDFLQAYDTVFHSYVKQVLTHIGVPPFLLALIMALVASMKAFVIINDGLTRPLPIERGLPQGSSLSAIIFVIILEPLLAYMRTHSISGLGARLAPRLHVDSHIPYLAYADDVDTPTTDVNVIIAWLKTAAQFETVSGLGINMVKTQVHLIGSAYWSPTVGTLPAAINAIATMRAACPGLPKDSYRIGDDVKYCGTILSLRDYREKNQEFGTLTQRSWSTRISKIIPLLGHFSMCPLRTWQDRKTFALTHLLSRVQFLAFSSPCPPKLLSILQQALNKFVFNQPTTPITLRIAATPPTLTGFSYVNLAIRFKAFSTSIYIQLIKGTLPPSLQALVSGVMIALLKKSMGVNTGVHCSLPMALHHQTAILDAVLFALHPYNTTTTATRIQVLLPINILPILHTGLISISPLELNRFFMPPSGPLEELSGQALLYENIHLNSAIMPRSPHAVLPNGVNNIHGQLPWPKLEHLLSFAAISLNRVADLYTTPPDLAQNQTTPEMLFNPGRALSASIHDVTAATITLALPNVHPKLQSLLSVIMNPAPPSSSILWSALVFPLLRPLVNITDAPPPLPSTSILHVLNTTATYHPLTYLSDISDTNSTRVIFSEASTKQIYQALSAITYNDMSPAEKVAAPFAPGNGWALYAKTNAYPHEAARVTKALEICRQVIPNHLYHSLQRVLYLQIVRHLPNHANHQIPGNHGHWPPCRRCGGTQLDPPHRLLHCIGLSAFWSYFRTILTALLPVLKDSLPAAGTAFTIYDNIMLSGFL